MLEIKFVRQNLETIQKALAARGLSPDLDAFKTCDDERRSILQELEALRHQRNVVSDQIAEMKKAGENADSVVAEMREVSTRIKSLDKSLVQTQETLEKMLLGMPNIPHSSVPVG
ncbi:MAG: serine--tRNA ligase, partial [Desulfobacterales bacterium]|nr:serine--tRNA ligase [Desulfobacterales bacterium]